MHDDAAVDDTPKRKPEMVWYYNRMKGGVDKMDQLAHTYTVKRRTKMAPGGVHEPIGYCRNSSIHGMDSQVSRVGCEGFQQVSFRKPYLWNHHVAM